MKLDSKKRLRVKNCPCGRSNKDGKFVPFKDHTCHGYCHSCDTTFHPDADNEQLIPKIIEPELKRDFRLKRILMTKSLRKYEENNFVRFLNRNFDASSVERVVKLYGIGTSNHWTGACIFWYIDINEETLTGKIMNYDSVTGKRIQSPFTQITWVHNKQNVSAERVKKSLFGEHLIDKNDNSIIGIVESEKTAVICAICFPEITWLASGGISNISYERLRSAKQKRIVLFPDLGGYEQWSLQAKNLNQWFDLEIFDYLELNATSEEITESLDIADFLLKNEAT